MNKKNRLQFKRWEIILLCFGALLFVGSATLYFGGISFYRYLFGLQDDQATQLFGKLSEKNGSTRRKALNSSEFSEIQKDAPLYNLDMVATGPDGTAVIQTEDGGVLELAPNSLVRLSLSSQLSLGGVSRVANVQVFTGTITGQAKARAIRVK